MLLAIRVCTIPTRLSCRAMPFSSCRCLGPCYIAHRQGKHQVVKRAALLRAFVFAPPLVAVLHHPYPDSVFLRSVVRHARLPCQDFDGGDCCECTCVAPDEGTACGTWTGFACVDPLAPCVDDDLVTVDMIGDCWISSLGEASSPHNPPFACISSSSLG